MKAVIHTNSSVHQTLAANAMKAGLERHGLECEFAGFDNPRDCDIAVCWGWHQERVKKAGRPILVVERGHIQPRMEIYAVGWNGIGRRATYAKARDLGARWDRLYSHHMKPWKTGGDYVLVLGQVTGDAALAGLDFGTWAQRTTEMARGFFEMPVVFRPHPIMVQRGADKAPKGASISRRELAKDLAGAAVAITFNSTSGVEAALAGVPVITLDPGAMAWPVATHNVFAGIRLTDRTEWANDLAWTTFSLDEIESGFVWDAVGPMMLKAAA